MDAAVGLTLNEAGFVTGQSAAAINRAVDKGVIRATIRRAGKARPRLVGPAEVRFLAISGAVAKDLTPAARRKVYAAMRNLPASEHRLAVGVMEFKLTDIDARIGERLRRLEQLKTLVDGHGDPDPVLRGTDLPVYAIAALTRGQTPAEIMADVSGLEVGDIETARDYAALYPKPGRPLPARSFKRALADMAGAGVWGVEPGDEVSASTICESV
jgi:uncharacterized protein (DUF433 family)